VKQAAAMKSWHLPPALIGALTFGLMLIALLFWVMLVFIPILLVKILLPIERARRLCTRGLVFVGDSWTATNRLIFRFTHAPEWRIEDRAGTLDPNRSYLLISNHQSWADILILCDLMHGRVPFLRFFLKQELFWVPLIGIACWGLEMPFMKRHSKAALEANPALRKEDLETTRRFCEKYRHQPVTVVNFLEGTRFTPAKREALHSPFRHLLRPKSAGLSFALNTMGDQFAGILDVTLAYRSARRQPLWSWLCGEQSGLRVQIDLTPIPEDMISGDYEADAEFRLRFQEWVNGFWARKDERLQLMLAGN
jgi:1-acyl-sn-glycerol-3-phosphate acyltransferase